jgi:hypothetical protein
MATPVARPAVLTTTENIERTGAGMGGAGRVCRIPFVVVIASLRAKKGRDPWVPPSLR